MTIQTEQLRCFAEQYFGPLERITIKRLSGGLDSRGVGRVQIQYAAAKPRTQSFVVKHLPDSGMREAEVYRVLGRSASRLAPALLGVAGSGIEGCIFLEWIRPTCRWPWRNQRATLAVIRRLAELHTQPLTGLAGVLANPHLESDMERS